MELPPGSVTYTATGRSASRAPEALSESVWKMGIARLLNSTWEDRTVVSHQPLYRSSHHQTLFIHSFNKHVEYYVPGPVP